MWWLLCLSLGHAEEPEDTTDEVYVYGELRVEQARQAIVEELEAQGFTTVIEEGNRTIYRNAQTWRGDVVLYDDGWSVVKRQPLHAHAPRMPWAKENSALAWAGCLLYPWMCVRSQGLTFSHRKWLGVETQTVDTIHDEVEVWGERLADLNTDRKVNHLPDLMERLWERGVPLEGEGVLGTRAERREALLDYWDSRTETPWGDRVCEAVESFMVGVIQHSDDPYTAAELRAFRERQHSTRALRLRVEPDP